MKVSIKAMIVLGMLLPLELAWGDSSDARELALGAGAVAAGTALKAGKDATQAVRGFKRAAEAGEVAETIKWIPGGIPPHLQYDELDAYRAVQRKRHYRFKAADKAAGKLKNIAKANVKSAGISGLTSLGALVISVMAFQAAEEESRPEVSGNSIKLLAEQLPENPQSSAAPAPARGGKLMD